MSNNSPNKDKKQGNHFNLDFIVFQRDGAYIAYCPALDISSSGQNFNEAMSNFYEMFQLHIECCIEAGTLQQDLINHSFTRVHRQKPS